MISQRLLFAVVPVIARGILRSLAVATRVRVLGKEHVDALERAGKRYVFVVWHGKMLLPVIYHRGQGIAAIVSRHKDGELIARTIHGLGYETVRGSSTRGGKEAYYEMIRFLKGAGPPGAIMPDGPRGPARAFKPGAVYIAKQSGASLVPLSFAARPRLTLGSWDAFTIPVPLARCTLAYGEPVDVPPATSDEAMEGLRALCEKRLNAVDALAEAALEKDLREGVHR